MDPVSPPPATIPVLSAAVRRDPPSHPCRHHEHPLPKPPLFFKKTQMRAVWRGGVPASGPGRRRAGGLARGKAPRLAGPRSGGSSGALPRKGKSRGPVIYFLFVLLFFSGGGRLLSRSLPSREEAAGGSVPGGTRRSVSL